MIDIKLRAKPYSIPIDDNGNTVDKPALPIMHLWSTNDHDFGLSSLEEEYIDRAAKRRTIESKLRVDKVNHYRRWVLKYDYFDNKKFNDIYEYYVRQCDDNYCMEISIDNQCSGCATCSCDCTTDNRWVRVYMEIGKKNYVECGKYFEGFIITFEESIEECNQ